MLAAGIFLLPSSAAAKGNPPGEVPAAVAQYVEMFPASSGPTTGSSRPNRVSPTVAKAIANQGGADATRLKTLLTSPLYGGPPDRASGSGDRPPAQPTIPKSLRRGSLGTLVTSSPGGTAVFWLLLVAATVLPFLLRRALRHEQRERAASAGPGPAYPGAGRS